VFYSSSIFGENVMVQVATKAAANPASAIGKAFNVPFVRDAAPSLQVLTRIISCLMYHFSIKREKK
jgi:hypothetical protein